MLPVVWQPVTYTAAITATDTVATLRPALLVLVL
jgi:hypothetical protein